MTLGSDRRGFEVPESCMLGHSCFAVHAILYSEG